MCALDDWLWIKAALVFLVKAYTEFAQGFCVCLGYNNCIIDYQLSNGMDSTKYQQIKAKFWTYVLVFMCLGDAKLVFIVPVDAVMHDVLSRPPSF